MQQAVFAGSTNQEMSSLVYPQKIIVYIYLYSPFMVIDIVALIKLNS